MKKIDGSHTILESGDEQKVSLTELPAEGIKLDHFESWSKSVITNRRSQFIIAFLTLGLVFGFGGYWASTAQIGGAVVAPGRVAAEGNNRVVQHLEGGILNALHVKEGDTVEAGDVLAKLDVTANTAQLESNLVNRAIQRIRLERWRAERDNATTFVIDLKKLHPVETNARVLEALESQVAEFNASKNSRQQNIALLDGQIANENADVEYLKDLSSSLERQANLIRTESEVLGDLFKRGLTGQTRVLALQREQSRIDGEKSNTISTALKSRNNISGFNDEKLKLRAEHSELTSQRITETQQRLNEINDVLLRLQDRQDRANLTTSVDGIVFRIHMKSLGAVVPPRQTIIEIFPTGKLLQIEARIPPQKINHIKLAQESDIVFSNDQASSNPPIKGKVTYISADTVENPDTGQSHYLVYVQIEDKIEGNTILPGNVADIFFQTEPKTFVEYIFDPITRFVGKAFQG